MSIASRGNKHYKGTDVGALLMCQDQQSGRCGCSKVRREQSGLSQEGDWESRLLEMCVFYPE